MWVLKFLKIEEKQFFKTLKKVIKCSSLVFFIQIYAHKMLKNVARISFEDVKNAECILFYALYKKQQKQQCT